LEYDPLFWVLSAGFFVASVMTLSRRLADSTRRKTGLMAFLYGALLLVFYSQSSCAGLSGTLSGYVYMSCQKVITVRADLAYNWIGTEPVGFLSSLSGIVGFTIASSGTKSGKWLLLAAILLGFFILAFIGRFVLPIFSPPVH
jgi:hypothetical protein